MPTASTLTLSAVVAMDENHVIGKNNQLPWHLPADLKHFKALTTGNAILMGRKTYQSIGKALPNRINIILTKDHDFSASDCVIANSFDQAIAAASNANRHELFIIGGAEIYRQFLPQISRIYLTMVHHHFCGDAFFPELNTKEWRMISREDYPADEKNPYAYSFLVMERV